MKTLVAWDNPIEAELLNLYVGAGDNEAVVCLTSAEALAQARQGSWDIVCMSLTFPKTVDEGFQFFEQVQQAAPGTPVLVLYRQTEMVNLPRFLNHGLRFYLVRDSGGDFMFLLLSSLESAAAAVRAEDSRKLAERLREEMDGVRRLQESVIPQGLEPPPGYQITARYEPAQMSVVGERPVIMAGGDYYDIFRPDDRTLVVLIGDASGHGLKACMSIMAMHTLIRMMSGERYRDTAAFVAEINQRLCTNSIVQSGGGFITLFFAAIDTINHVVTWTSAGHPLALLHRRETKDVVQVGTATDTGMPLGIFPDVEYPSSTLTLPPDSRLLVYSDGLTDALPQEGQDAQAAFGVRGITETLLAYSSGRVEETLDQLFRAASAFTGGTGRHDDTSVVLVERHAI
jgi:sigma-B regulation protein RsbU (phosphoserine phosphatase)